MRVKPQQHHGKGLVCDNMAQKRGIKAGLNRVLQHGTNAGILTQSIDATVCNSSAIQQRDIKTLY